MDITFGNKGHMRRAKKPLYRKPNLNNLRGRKGRRLLEEIRNLPPTSIKDLKIEIDKYVESIANGENGKN